MIQHASVNLSRLLRKGRKMMSRYNKSVLMFALALVMSSVGINQAYALNDDEAAVLMGLAVGGITAYAVKHHREHDRNDWRATSAQHPPRYSDPQGRRDRNRHEEYRGHYQAPSHARPFHSKVVIIDNSRGWGHKRDYYRGHAHGHRHGRHCGHVRF